MEQFFSNIKLLCELDGISGREDLVVDEIISQIKDYCEYRVDNLNNIIAFKKGKKTPNKKIMLVAHTDEVGMIVTGVNTEGLINFSTVGGIDPKVILGRTVKIYGNECINGVIGTKAVHMQKEEERNTMVPIENLYIDIGSKSKEETLNVINLGDSVAFCSDYIEFGENLEFIKTKAIDDRGGCAMLIEIIKSDLEYDTNFLFCVQEEVGLRGSKVGTYAINPDIAIVVESTASGDVSGVTGNNRVSELGKGPVITYMDLSTIYDKKLFDLTFKLAKEHSIPCQTKTMISGGNDAGAIHISRNGVRTIAVSMPSRYIHSSSCVVKKSDVLNCLKLVKIMLNSFAEIE